MGKTYEEEFMAKLFHKVRSPLTAIKEGVSLVLEEAAGKINEDQKKLLTTAFQNVDKLKNVIEEFQEGYKSHKSIDDVG